MPVHRHQLRRLAAVLVLAAGSWFLSGCGSSHTDATSADPASVVPASAPLYGAITARPRGKLKAASESAARALTHQGEPAARLLGALRTPGSPALSLAHEVDPWLGPHVAIFLSSPGVSRASSTVEEELGRWLELLVPGLFGRSSPASGFPFATAGGAAGGANQGAIVLDTSNVAKARSFLGAQAARAGGRPASYRGVSYLLTSGGLAFGVIDRFAVVGTGPALRSVIDTALGGPALADTGGYSKLLAFAPAGVIAHLYVNPGEIGPGGRTPGAQGPSGALQLLAGGGERNISLVPSATSIAIDVDSPAGAAGGLLAALSGGAQSARELPAKSWLAVGLGDLGPRLPEVVRGLSALITLGGAPGQPPHPTGGLSVKGLLEGVLTPLGALGADSAAARRQFQSWMGSAGIFASGSGLVNLQAALAIASTEPALSHAAVGKLGEELRAAGATVQPVSIPGTDAALLVRLSELPIPLYVANGRAFNGQTKFVIGLSEPSVASALNPSSVLLSAGTLGTAPAYAAAGAALGEGIQPSLLVNCQSLLGVLEGIGLGEDPTITPVAPYLRSLTTLAGGGKLLGAGVVRFRLILSLRPSG